MKNLNDFFGFLCPDTLLNYTDEQLIESATKFSEKYSKDESENIVTEILGFRNSIKKQISENKIMKISEIVNYLFIEHYSVASSLPDLCSAYILNLTLTVISAADPKDPFQN